MNIPYTATAIKKLEDEGIAIIGKTNLDEFAIGTLGDTSSNGIVLNPLNSDYMVGGSSSGAAASVASDYCHVAIASDTGGSARIPAAMTGVLGFKPSYGSVSRYGLLSFSPSYDQISFISKSIDHIKETYLTCRGKDIEDMTSTNHEDVSFRGHTIGVLKLNNSTSIATEVIDNYNCYIDYLMELGFMISEMDIPNYEEIIAAYQVLTSAEAASNLSRFTGLNYGTNLGDLQKNRSSLFGDMTKNRIILGNHVLNCDDSQLLSKAELIKNTLKSKFDKIFAEVDVLITPTTPLQPLKVNEISDNSHFFDLFTCIANLIGAPSLVFPFGKYQNSNLPMSIQIISPRFSDLCLLDFYKEIKY
jgi:aspartyl-tRNA(Asn)/glutamyl-tRNA(Gln) amidotransferase subunit A